MYRLRKIRNIDREIKFIIRVSVIQFRKKNCKFLEDRRFGNLIVSLVYYSISMFGHAWFRRRDESMHLSALVKRRFDCAYQRGQAWKTIGLASWRMTCLARAHAHSKPRTHGFTTYSLQHRGHWHQAVELCRTFSFSNRFIYRIVPFICYGILCVLERDGNFDIELKKKDGMCIDFITSRYGNL